MNGVHDMGGMTCFGPLEIEEHEPVFHTQWERDVFALTLAMGATGSWNIDQARSMRESLPPAEYLSASYYEIWLAALENLLLKHGLVTQKELTSGQSQQTPQCLPRVLQPHQVAEVLSTGAPVEREATQPAKYRVGDAVRARNLHIPSHTRLPAYIRGHSGVITHLHGFHVFADSQALDRGEKPQWLYSVRFEAHELWGNTQPHATAIQADCWESYLQPLSVDIQSPPRGNKA